ncbi:Aerotolerance protein BatA [hydrothermal vent metagenome]|uniref:Aerotolerance protein BatA n=1 Tax=hydrothermal vent metagenome TaxID=652676 RepID=A0A3B0YII4_9ZZZZ
MMSFGWPWIFFLLPLPWLLRKLLPQSDRENDAALRVPHLQPFQMAARQHNLAVTRWWPFFLYTLVWICLLLAAARPQWVGDTVELPIHGRDLMMAIDLSGSMGEDFDFQGTSTSKLDATKTVAGRFIDKRVGDRIGLILFGEKAYVQAPLTFDRSTVKTLLSETFTGLAGNATAIGDAIGLAVKRMHESGNSDQLLILLTDGINNAGEVKPNKAADLAAREGMTIHTIGVGNNYQNYLDEATLTYVAQTTGGQYFRARDIDELEGIYNLISELEPVARENRSYRPTWSLFYWPLTLALTLAAILGLLLWRERI